MTTTAEHTTITTLWLSQLVINSRSTLAAAELTNAKSMINRMMNLFTDPPRQPDGLWDRAALGLLYRIEHGIRTPSRILIQSTAEPDPANLPPDYGTLTTKPMSEFVNDLTNGDQVKYCITLNPVTKDPGSSKRRVLDSTEADEQWHNYAERAGLNVHTSHATRQPTLVWGKMRVALRQFDGHATITDADTLRTAMLRGIGSTGKSHAAGLLSLKHATGP